MKKILNFTDRHTSAIFILPAIILLCLFILIPFIITLILSLLNYSPVLPGKNGEFIWFLNYIKAFSDETFLQSLYLTGKFSLFCVSIELILASIISFWLYKNINLAKFVLPVLILPAAFPPVTTALIWKFLIQSEFGLLSYYIKLITDNVHFTVLGDELLAFSFLIFVDIWQWTPLVTLILLIGLKNINKQSIDAAKVDGASNIRVVKDIIFHQLKPYIIVALVLRTLDSIKVFEKVYVLTGGGPGNSTELINIYLWRTSFKFWDSSYGAALSILVYLITLTLLLMSFNKLKFVLRWD